MARVSPHTRQRGLALLIVLVVVALGSVIAVALVERSQRALARTQALADRQQVMQLSAGMALITERLLDERLRQADGVLMPEALAQWTPAYDIPGGTIQGRAWVLDGRFNLNALTHPTPERRGQARVVFGRLLRHLQLNARLGDEIMAWLDSAAQAQPNPTDAPRAPLVHVSELREVPGLDEAAYDALMPHIAVWPSPRLALNVNATEPEVLAAFVEALDVTAARRVLASRPFRRSQDLWAEPVLAGASLTPEERDRLTVESGVFLAQARVRFARDGRVQTHDGFRLIQTAGSGYDFRYVSQGVP